MQEGQEFRSLEVRGKLIALKMDRKSGLLSNIDFLFNQPTIETYCNNAGDVVCQYVLSKYYEN